MDLNITRRRFHRVGTFPMLVAMAFVLATSTPAIALFGGGGRIVFDPTNYVKNSMTAIQQYLDTANSYVQMAQDIKQTARKIENVKETVLSLNSPEGKALLEFIDTGKNVYGALRKTQQVNDDMQRLFVASGQTSWEDFVRGIGERRAHGDTLAKTLYDSANLAEKQLSESYDQHMKLVKQMPRIQGVTDAAIATSQSVGIIIQQNQGMMQLMAQNARTQGQELQREAIERQQEEEFKRKYLENAKALTDRERAFLRGQSSSGR